MAGANGQIGATVISTAKNTVIDFAKGVVARKRTKKAQPVVIRHALVIKHNTSH